MKETKKMKEMKEKKKMKEKRKMKEIQKAACGSYTMDSTAMSYAVYLMLLFVFLPTFVASSEKYMSLSVEKFDKFFPKGSYENVIETKDIENLRPFYKILNKLPDDLTIKETIVTKIDDSKKLGLILVRGSAIDEKKMYDTLFGIKKLYPIGKFGVNYAAKGDFMWEEDGMCIMIVQEANTQIVKNSVAWAMVSKKFIL